MGGHAGYPDVNSITFWLEGVIRILVMNCDNDISWCSK